MIGVLVGAGLGVLVALWLRVKSFAGRQGDVRVRRPYTLVGGSSIFMLLLLLVAVGARLGPIPALVGGATLALWIAVLYRFILPGVESGYYHQAVEPEPEPPQPPAPELTPVDPPRPQFSEFELSDEISRVHCRTCGGVLSAPLREIFTETPALFGRTGLCDPVKEDGAPERGTFWRSRSEWPGRLGPTFLSGLRFGTEGEVVMFHPDDRDGTTLPYEYSSNLAPPKGDPDFIGGSAVGTKPGAVRS